MRLCHTLGPRTFHERNDLGSGEDVVRLMGHRLFPISGFMMAGIWAADNRGVAVASDERERRVRRIGQVWRARRKRRYVRTRFVRVKAVWPLRFATALQNANVFRASPRGQNLNVTVARMELSMVRLAWVVPKMSFQSCLVVASSL